MNDKPEYTFTNPVGKIWVCDDCGATFGRAQIDDGTHFKFHHKTCKPGMSEYWINYYNEAAEMDDPDMADYHDAMSGNF